MYIPLIIQERTLLPCYNQDSICGRKDHPVLGVLDGPKGAISRVSRVSSLVQTLGVFAFNVS